MLVLPNNHIWGLLASKITKLQCVIWQGLLKSIVSHASVHFVETGSIIRVVGFPFGKKRGFTDPEPCHVHSHVCSSDSCMCLHTHLWQRMIGLDLRAALCAVSVWGRFTVCTRHAACHHPEGSAGVWRAHHCINGAPSSRSNVSPPPPVKKNEQKKKQEKKASLLWAMLITSLPSPVSLMLQMQQANPVLV